MLLLVIVAVLEFVADEEDEVLTLGNVSLRQRHVLAYEVLDVFVELRRKFERQLATALNSFLVDV